MIDPEVNIAIIREADGVVSHIDAINIDRFEKKSKRIFYTNSLGYAYNFDKISTFPRFLSYSKWMEAYKKYIRYDLFNTHLNPLDLPAGTIGLRLKVKKDYYNKSVDFLRTKIENAKDYAQYQDEEENIMDYLKDEIQNKHNKYVSKMKIYEVYKKYENDVLYILTDPSVSNSYSNFGSPQGSPRQYSIPDSTENNTNNIHDEIPELDDPLNNLLISDKSTYVGSNDDDDKEIDTIIHKELNERNKEEYQKFFHFSNANNINVFDELLLLDLFRNIISIKIKKKENEPLYMFDDINKKNLIQEKYLYHYDSYVIFDYVKENTLFGDIYNHIYGIFQKDMNDINNKIKKLNRVETIFDAIMTSKYYESIMGNIGDKLLFGINDKLIQKVIGIHNYINKPYCMYGSDDSIDESDIKKLNLFDDELYKFIYSKTYLNTETGDFVNIKSRNCIDINELAKLIEDRFSKQTITISSTNKTGGYFNMYFESKKLYSNLKLFIS